MRLPAFFCDDDHPLLGIQVRQQALAKHFIALTSFNIDSMVMTLIVQIIVVDVAVVTNVVLLHVEQ